MPIRALLRKTATSGSHKMAAFKKVGGSNVALTTFKIRSGGAWANITSAKRRVSGAWVEMLGSALGIGGSTSANGLVSATEPAPTTAVVTSAPATIVATGGTGAYTYAWTHISGDAGITTTSPTAASTTFSATVTKNVARTAVRRCTLNDGVTTLTRDVTVTLEYITNI